MKNMIFGWRNLALCFAALSLTVAVLVAQPRRPAGPPEPPGPPPGDVLAGLKHMLTAAGAPALSSQQEQQLTQLIETARENRPKGPNETLEAARRAYDSAVLAGNLAAANSQAAIIAQQISADANSHLQAEAKFKIDALNVLKTNSAQITALTQFIGTQGLSHLLDSLAGGPPRPSPGGPGGPGGFGRLDSPPLPPPPPPPPNGDR